MDELDKLTEIWNEKCNIDRKTIFNILSYIISTWDTNFDISQEIYFEEIDNKNYCFHQLTIESQNEKNKFKAIVDYVYINSSKTKKLFPNYDLDTYINFYDLKSKLPIIEQTTYAKDFMGMIEDKFKKGEKITKNDCNDFLREVVNKKKQKIKRKDS